MSFLDKLKNVFFEEVEDDEEDTVEEEPLKLAKKIEFPKRKERVIENKKSYDDDNGDFFAEDKVVKPQHEEFNASFDVSVELKAFYQFLEHISLRGKLLRSSRRLLRGSGIVLNNGRNLVNLYLNLF